MWKKIDAYCVTNGTYNICKVTVNGKLTYELWIKGGERLGIFNSFDEAKGKLDEKK